MITLITTNLFGGSSVSDFLKFVACAKQNILTVGTVFPLSEFVAKEMMSQASQYIDASTEPIRFLEVGAGTGALSDYFATALAQTNKPFILDLVEIEPEYCALLEEKFAKNPNVHVHCMDICKFPSKKPYDIVVSTLPFNSKFFTAKSVAVIMNQFATLSKQDGLLMTVEYAVCGKINRLFMNSQTRVEFDEKHRILAEFRAQYMSYSKIVYLNVPPTHLFVSKISK